MASKQPHLCLVLLSFMLICSLSFSSPPSDVDSICANTPYPTFCRSILPRDKPGTVQDYGKFSVGQALAMANNFLSIVNQQIATSKRNSTTSQFTLYVLEDCRFLAGLNVDFLSTTDSTIKPSIALRRADIDQLQTLLSGVLTNFDTCFDGVRSVQSRPDSKAVQDLSPHFNNGTMLFSVSLAIFAQGWAPKATPGRSLFTEEEHTPFFFNRKINVNEYWPSKLKPFTLRDDNNKARKLLQLGNMGIQVNKMVVVNPNGSGNFTTITDAVASAPNNTKANTGYFGIYVVAGVYEEYVVVPSNKKYLLLVGDGINQTIFTGNRSVDGNWTTFNSASFAVTAIGFVAVNITFRNTAGAVMHQAVALRSGADLSVFYKCSFEGYQDTLYTHSLRQFYRECDVYGTVDFIFGNAEVVLQNCNIYPRQPLKGQFNAITAQGKTDPNQNTGTSIHNCVIKATDDLISSNFTVKTYLGRPWKLYSTTVYMQSSMDSSIDPAGWHDWSGTFALDTLYYAEYNNTGPGSNTTARVTWLGYHVIDNATDASNFTVSNFITGDFWLNSTGVPYTGGLL